jgi:hypothetical protein
MTRQAINLRHFGPQNWQSLSVRASAALFAGYLTQITKAPRRQTLLRTEGSRGTQDFYAAALNIPAAVTCNGNLGSRGTSRLRAADPLAQARDQLPVKASAAIDRSGGRIQ